MTEVNKTDRVHKGMYNQKSKWNYQNNNNYQHHYNTHNIKGIWDRNNNRVNRFYNFFSSNNQNKRNIFFSVHLSRKQHDAAI